MPENPQRIPVVMAAGLIASDPLRKLLSGRAELALDPMAADLGDADAFVASSHHPRGSGELARAQGLAVATNVGTAVRVDAAIRLGIPVLHNPGANALSVAEHTLALHGVPLIDAARLARLPRHAWVVNTARADVLDYDALVAAFAGVREVLAGHRPTASRLVNPRVGASATASRRARPHSHANTGCS